MLFLFATFCFIGWLVLFSRLAPWRNREAQRQALLRIIAGATEASIPLAPVLAAWSNDQQGRQRARVRRLSKLIAAGRPLADAIEETPGALREQDVLALRFGSQSGTLASSLRNALEESDAPAADARARIASTKAYFVVVLCVAVCIVAFIEIKIVPAFMSIFEDFDLSTPQFFQWSLWVTYFFEEYWYVFALILLLVGWGAYSKLGRRLLRRTPLGRLGGSSRDLIAADLLDKLGVASRSGRPVAGALSTLARYHFDPATRHQLLFIRNEVEQGADIWNSMVDAGLLTKKESAVLGTADRVGNRAWALEQLAGAKNRRTLSRVERYSQWLRPALVLFMGGFVMLHSLAVFQALSFLVTNLLF